MGTGRELGLKVGVAVVGVCLGAAGVVVTRDEGPSFERNRAPVGASVQAPTTTEAPTAEEIAAAVEVEAGLTAGNVFACDVPDGGELGFYPHIDDCPPERLSSIGDTVSYGVVLENTSDQMLMSVPVTLTFYDAAGALIPEPSTVFSDADLATREVTVAKIRPGQRVGFGGMSYLDRPGATRIEVTIGEPWRWMPQAEADMFDIGTRPLPLTTTEVQSVSSGDSGEPIVHFTITTTSDEPIRLEAAYAVLRDEAGRIIGGIEEPFFTMTVSSSRTTEGEVALGDPMKVPGIDPTKVEIFVGPVVI